MSEIITNKLTGKTSAGDIDVTSEGGAVTMQLQQGLAKAWITYGDTASAGNPAIYQSFNFSSIADNGTGDTTYSYTNNMSVAKGYSISGVFAHSSDITTYVYQAQPKQDDSVTTGTLRIVQVYAGATASGVGDYDYVSNTIHGDLA